MNLFWLLVALGACPEGVTWAHGREVTAATWRAASARRGWVAGRLSGSGSGSGSGGSGSGSGYYGYGGGGGDGAGYYGYGCDYGSGSVAGYGGGDGYGYYGCGCDYGDGSGYGYYGYGDGYGSGAGDGYGYGSGYGAGDGDGYDPATHKDIISVEFDDGSKLTDGEGISTSAELIVGQLWQGLVA